jgi:ElaB/YqjD/DUF883 family membrane-anchored ribosome-binding protein
MARNRNARSDKLAAGTAAVREAKATIDDTIAMVGEKGEEALQGLRGVGESLVEGIEDALHERPIVTVGVAIGVGFLLGAAWRR